MARRAAFALTSALALAAIVLPTALIMAAATPAEAARAAGSQLPATVAFTGVNPLWASPGKKLTISGTVKNTAPVAQALVVELLDSPQPVTTVSDLQASAAAGSATGQVSSMLTASWTSGVLQPGGTASWSFSVPVSAMGMTTFGVYKVAAQVLNTRGGFLVNALTYVPYLPAKKGPFGSSLPSTQKVSLVWPLLDQPLLDEPWQDACTGSQAAALARSLSRGGRLSNLVESAGASASTAVVQAQADAGRAARQQEPATELSQNLASADGLTWAVDPALLVNAAALSQCGSRQPQWAQAASAWLNRLRAVTADQPLFVTPYGDPDVATLISADVGHVSAGLGQDLDYAFTGGQARAIQILRRTQPLTSGLAWAPDGPTTYFTLEHLASRDGVGTLLLSSSAYPSEPVSALRTHDGGLGGGIMNVLLANDSLTKLLGSAGSAPGSGFATAQQFLAETALLAKQNPSTPIIVAPPRRWQPVPGLTTNLLTAIASAPWLSPTTLGSLTAARHIPTVNNSPQPTDPAAFGPVETGQLQALDSEVAQLESIKARPDVNPHLAVSTVESSAYTGTHRSTAFAMIGTLLRHMDFQERRVHIVAESRITLGGTRGSVPVSIDNPLGYPVSVRLQVSYPKTGGTRVTPSPAGPVTVPAGIARTVKLRIAATHVGTTTITLFLVNSAGQPLTGLNSAGQPLKGPYAGHPFTVLTTVQTSQVGLLGVIIFGAALGVFLVASGVRALRRGKPRPGPGEPDESGLSDDHPSGQSTEEAAPDTVVAEQGELGTAGTPRPR